jgi:hypothetical protein
MEKEKEIAKLVNVLHRIARAAGYSMWSNADQDATRFCATQYNKVLARLGELEPAAAQLFTPLDVNASPHVIHMAARELAAYFEDETPHHARQRPRYVRCGPRRGMWYAAWSSPQCGRSG